MTVDEVKMMSSDHMATIFCAFFPIHLIINTFNTLALKTSDIVHAPHPYPYQIFRKRGLDRTSVFRGGGLFQRGCSFYIKNKLKSEIFNDKKGLINKTFFSAITKNVNCEILT